MPAEGYIAARLLGDAPLAGALAVWKGTPAVFARLAPADDDPGWQGKPYPRIVFLLDRAQNPADILTGTLRVQVWGRDDVTEALDTIVTRLGGPWGQGVLDESAHNTDEGLLLLNWQQANTFSSDADERVFGVEMVYAMRAFDRVDTYTPDPIAALNRFVDTYLDRRIETSRAAWAPADDKPGLYWRPVSRSSQTNDLEKWGFWLTLRVEGHVFAPGVYARVNWTRLIADSLRDPRHRFIGLGDGSCLRVLGVNEDLTVSPYTRGQIQLDVRYGVRSDEAIVALQGSPVPAEPPPAPAPLPTVGGGATTPPIDVDTITGQPIQQVRTRGTVTFNEP